MATVRYWDANYWNANYWQSAYWSTASGGEIVGQIAASTVLDGAVAEKGAYWGENYWNSNYWGSGYWSEYVAPQGTVFVGTFDNSNDVTGTVSASTSLSAAIVGTTSQVVFLDVDVGFTVSWQFSELSTYTGSMGATLSGFSGSVSGQFSEDFIGTLAPALSDTSGSFSGTFVAPANRSGVIATELGASSSSFGGLVVGAGSIGTVAATLEDATPSFVGAVSTSDTSGTISVSLDAVTASWTGIFAGSDSAVGTTVNALADFTADFNGTSVYDFRTVSSERVGETPRDSTRVGSRKTRKRVASRRK